MLPALAANGLGDALELDGFWFHLAEGALRLGIFLGYLLLIGALPDIKRVFQYHGAEHKAIAAYENDVELTPESAQPFTTEHVRCGTNFLLTVMVVTIVVYSFVGRPALAAPHRVADRADPAHRRAQLRGHPVRGEAHGVAVGARSLMRPGLALQRLTTREPTLDQLEVAIASLRAVLTAEQLAEVESRSQPAAHRCPSRPRHRLTAAGRPHGHAGKFGRSFDPTHTSFTRC